MSDAAVGWMVFVFLPLGGSAVYLGLNLFLGDWLGR